MFRAFSDHEMSEAHKQTTQEFEDYKEFYNETVEQVFDQTKALYEKYDKKLDLDTDIQSLDEMEKKVWNIVQLIEKDRKWKSQLNGLKKLVKKLACKIQETQDLIENGKLAHCKNLVLTISNIIIIAFLKRHVCEFNGP